MTPRTCHAGTSLSLLIAVKGNLNATAYEDILDSCVLPTLWKQFGEDPRMDMIVWCQHTFGHTVYHTGLTKVFYCRKYRFFKKRFISFYYFFLLQFFSLLFQMYRPTPKQNTGMASNYSTTTPAYTTAHNSTKEENFRCEKSYDGESLLLCIIITLFASIFLIIIMSITWLKTYQTMKRRIRSLQNTQQQALFLPSAETDPSEKSSGPEQIITVQLEQNAISASEFNLQSMKSASSSFNKANLMMHQLIKAGKEGMLYKAKMTHGAINGHTMFTCKIYKRAAKPKLVKREVMIMRTLNTHSNLLQLVDWDITEEPYMLIMENVEHGSLHTYLKANKDRLCKQEELQHLFTIALYHIAQAMDHLHSKMILHCNLALRNIMVQRFPHEVKLAEFGLARDITRGLRLSGNCEKTNSKRIPFRWYPPEYFKDNLYGFKGDVWAFGIVVWEMQTFGKWKE
ncbi:fibroblast growth factor receptor homolog 1-like isoform X3 [Ictalurus furcatus]|uniref:fibroblast growth factor receptor homolog 1-like isoform X3 n=1 Tax=Ictalurus furcatus TaxID=66913 RepID=UPI002350C1E5|nr:fibroblast growth factor receptor homolog 1-like isoform X3 [Ictalurus furcatus]